MQSAEFRVKRQALGLTIEEIGHKEEVPPSVVVKWEREIEPPANLAAWLEEKWEDHVALISESIEQIEAPGAERPVDLYQYFTDDLSIYISDRSESEWAAYVSTLAIYCDSHEIPYVISYTYPPPYPLT